MERLQPLLRTKLYPSACGELHLLPRQALLERLFECRMQRLLMISAPAGFGKSTVLGLLREQLIRSGARVAWLSCDAADSQPVRLLHYLTASIEAASPGFGRYTRRLLGSEPSVGVETLRDAFMADLEAVGQPLYVILDDFHLLRHAGLAVHGNHLLERLPGHVHFIVSSRYVPRVVQRAVQAFAQVSLFSDQDLRLSRGETADYLSRVKGLALDEEALDALHQRSDGWITVLHLAYLSLSAGHARHGLLEALSGTQRMVADYLTEDVLQRLPQDLQRFLEQTSVLSEFSADLCQALTGRPESAELISRLQREQLFVIALDGEGKWFRYHHLFAEYLQGRLARHADVPALLSLASDWCENNGRLEQAIHYALRARDYPRTARLLEEAGGQLVAGNRVYSILGMLDAIPQEVLHEYPVFQIFLAWRLAFDQQYAQSQSLIEEIGQRLLQGKGQPFQYGLAELLVATQVLKALVLLYQDKLQACLEVTRQWLGRVPQDEPVFYLSMANVQAASHILLGNFPAAEQTLVQIREVLGRVDSAYLTAIACLIEVLLCREAGELERGLRLAEHARHDIEQGFGRHSRVAGPLLLVYADMLYDMDRHGEVLDDLPQAIAWRDVATPLELIGRGHLVQVRAQFFAGHCERALADLQAWIEQLRAPGSERVLSMAVACKMHLLLWLLRPHEAERSSLLLDRHLETQPEGKVSPAVGWGIALARARLALYEQQGDRAHALLQAALAELPQERQTDHGIRLKLLLSIACWQRGQAEEGFALLQQVLQFARERGYRRLCLDEAPWLLPMWAQWLRQEPEQAGQWATLHEALFAQCRRLSLVPEHLENMPAFSAREREILQLVAAGLSNRAIAVAVHLSEATVKWHLHNLFSRLQVKSRTQAVIEGKRLGIIVE